MGHFTVTDGTIPFRGHHTWYQVIGDKDGPGRLPVLCVHGGPGVPHDYLEPLGALAATGRRVIFYDQLGCGHSAVNTPHDPSFWSVALYVEEVGAVRAALGLEQVHLLGQSWGGMLAMEYALTQPRGLAGLILEGAPASMPQWMAEANRLRAELPADLQAVLRQHEAAGTTSDPAYEAAMLAFYQRHVCRLDPWPDCLLRSFAQLQANPEVYNTMNGPSEFCITGTLRDWDITRRLSEIRLPTLVLSGRHDEATPAIAATVQRGIPGAEWVLFEHSAHMCHLEEPEATLAAIDGFLSRVEAKPR
jgi:L-proline amide hydrolase